MPDGQVLEFTRVTKRFNEVTAVSDFSARIEPGAVTAFLGPNGAGKTTSLRILLGQVRATSGTATIGGAAFSELRNPLRTIGSVLEETVYRPRRSAARQLTIAAKANGIPLSRVDEVLSLVGLENEADGRIGSFSLGMRQRLSVAHALLGDPGALVFDEPANGLDPEGIRWMRLLMRRLADEGRTVLVSSHVLSEVEQVADNVLVLSRGQLMLSSGIETLADPSSGAVVVDAADRAALTAALSAGGFEVEVLRSGLTVRGGDAGTVGAIAAEAGIALTTLVQRGPTLEDIFIELVRGGRHAPREIATPAIVVPPVREDEAATETATASPEQTADEPAADEAPADAPAAETLSDVPAEAALPETSDTVDADADADASADYEVVDSPAQPSFDDILFGTGGETGDAHTATGPESEQSDADDAEHSGLEAFAGLHHEAPTGEDADDAKDADDADAEAPSVPTHTPDEESDADPRSEAVSSMLAAAARAYYQDEPKQYPFAEDDNQPVAEGGSGSDDAAAVGDDGEHHEHHEHHDGEHREHHDGEHRES
nr:ATP-binding cassette domain-containing protein [Microbacterium hydrocarbonoxydans]